MRPLLQDATLVPSAEMAQRSTEKFCASDLRFVLDGVG